MLWGMVISCTSGSMFSRWMVRKSAISFFLTSFVIITCFSQVKPDDQRLREMVMNLRQAEVIIPYQGERQVIDLSRHVSISSVRENKIIIELSPLDVEWFISQQFDYTISERNEAKGIISSRSMAEAMSWESYPTYTQYDSIMRFFANEYPSLCCLDTIGTSNLGKLVLVLKISDNCHMDEAEPRVFYTSSMHGNEIGGFILMLRLADYLLSNYESNQRVRELVDNLEIWINPLANPDGTYNNGNEIDSPVRYNAKNYDLNRNFPDTSGPFTVRQKETLDMMKFLSAHRFVLSANFHSGEEVVNYPWDRWKRDHADKDWFYAISRKYADTAHLYSPAGYMTFLDNGVTNGYVWYQVNGSRQDYVTYELQGREVTIELDDDFITPVQDLNSLWESNRRSLLGYMENARNGISGSVRDAETHNPVPAKIFVEDHDMDNSEIYADTLTGRFLRMIEPGIWDITFSADGYQTITLTGIASSTEAETELDIEMERVLNPIDTTNQDKPLLYPNPARDYIRVILPEDIMGLVNVKIFNMVGEIVLDEEHYALYGNPVQLDLSKLPSAIYYIIFTNGNNGLLYKSSFVKVR
jgi:hypothetical protein